MTPPCYPGSKANYTFRRSILLISATTSFLLGCVGLYDYFFNPAPQCAVPDQAAKQ